LNAKLDLGDKSEECHGLTTGASHEKTLRHRNGKKIANKQTLAGEAHGNDKTSTAKHLTRKMPFAYSWALNKAEFCTRLTLKLSGAEGVRLERQVRTS